MAEAAKQIVTQDELAAPVAPPVPAETAYASMIERAARDPNVDIDKMERLMRMHEQAMDRAAKMAYAKAMASAQAEMKPVVRNKRNEQTRSAYADLEAISDAIQPIINKYGFSLTYDTDDCPLPGCQRIVCDVLHDAGHSRRHHADIPIDAAGLKGNSNKTATHAFGSTVSYGRRYVKLMIFDIATRDDRDGNRAPAQTDADLISDEQAQALRNALTFKGRTEADFCKVMKSDSIDNLQASRFKAALAYIEKLPQLENNDA